MIGSLREIQLFVAAYEERSFTAAAMREGATQSGVSQHIRRLEDRLGTRLFLRERGTIVPSPAAERYYAGCIETLRANLRATEAMRSFRKGAEGVLKVGVMPTMAQSILKHAILEFTAENPNVTLEIVDGFSTPLNRMVQADEVDVAIVPEHAGMVGIRARSFCTVPEVLISGLSSPLEHGKPVVMRELEGLKIVAPRRSNIRRQMLETYFAQAGVRVERMLDMDSILGTADLIENSDWTTVWPALIADVAEPPRRLKMNPLVGPELDLQLILIEPARRPISDLAARFVGLLEERTKALATPWRAAREAG